MKISPEKASAEAMLQDLPPPPETAAFKAEEMIACGKCARRNPPNRLKCLYCGAELEPDENRSRFVKPVLRKLEAWEKGFNIIYLPEDGFLSEPQQNEIAKMARLEKSVLQKISEARIPLPIARAESAKEAAIVSERLAEAGVKTLILSDEKLNAEKPPKRLRGIEFGDGALRLRLFNTDETIGISKEDLILIVTGAIFERRIEATEQYNRKGDNKLLNSSETTSDESLIDVYSRADETGFRIERNGFDFSCLGAEKTLLAARNIQTLSGKLKEFAPGARFVENYVQIRAALGGVWEIGERKDSRGLVKEKLGKYNLGNVTTANNMEQFTKYSRMLRNIYETEK